MQISIAVHLETSKFQTGLNDNFFIHCAISRHIATHDLRKVAESMDHLSCASLALHLVYRSLISSINPCPEIYFTTFTFYLSFPWEKQPTSVIFTYHDCYFGHFPNLYKQKLKHFQIIPKFICENTCTQQ